MESLAGHIQIIVIFSPFQVTGQWTKTTAGGCANNPSYSNNPVYMLEIISNTPAVVLIKLEVSK